MKILSEKEIIKIKTFIMGIYIYLKNYKYSNPQFSFESLDKILFIAHPDDEVVFFYNELLKNQGWLVICITNGDNEIRLYEFINSMKKFKCNYKIWNFEDNWSVIWNRNRLDKKIEKILKIKKWTKILTHNSQGEYGHPQHKQLNKIVRQLCREYDVYVPIKKESLLNERNLLAEDIRVQKINHMKIFYKSQERIINEFKSYFYYENIELLKNDKKI